MNALKIQLRNDIENYIIKDNKKIETVFIGGELLQQLRLLNMKKYLK
jgi:hypothetical protein